METKHQTKIQRQTPFIIFLQKTNFLGIVSINGTSQSKYFFNSYSFWNRRLKNLFIFNQIFIKQKEEKNFIFTVQSNSDTLSNEHE
jgi:hypothetical protein